jgi:hypothetical protein
MRIEYEPQKWLSGNGVVVRDKAVHLYNRCTASVGEEKGSFHASKGLFEKFKKQMGQHNLNRIGESACANRVACTSYSEHFKKTIEKNDYS